MKQLTFFLLGWVLMGCNGLAQQQDVQALQSSVTTLSEELKARETTEALLSEQGATLAALQAAVAELGGTISTQVGDQINQVCRPVPVLATEECRPEVVLHDQRMVVGEVERVRVEPPGFITSARIDTGAQSSSLHAQNITEFERDGDDWVRFDVIDKDLNVTIERPVEKYVRVFQQSDKDGSRRPVVKMRILIGNVRDTFEFTLADRSHLQHNMILGRNFLTDIALVDVGRQYVQPLPGR